MAIKGVVDYNAERLIHYFSSGTFEKGVCLVMATGNYSGLAFENANRYAYVAVSSSGSLTPLGISEAKVVNYDLTRQKLNPFDPNEVQQPGKISIVRHGYLDTNFVSGNPTPGNTAYLASNGYVAPTGQTGWPTVGKFLTGKDGNGFATLYVDL